jgi:hypothetical protein
MANNSRSWEPRSGSGHVVRYNHIITGQKATTDVVTPHIDESAVLDRKVVRGVKSTRRSRRTEYKFVRHLGGDWFIISCGIRKTTSLGLPWLRHSIEIISTSTNSCMEAQAYKDAIERGGVSYCQARPCYGLKRQPGAYGHVTCYAVSKLSVQGTQATGKVHAALRFPCALERESTQTSYHCRTFW